MNFRNLVLESLRTVILRSKDVKSRIAVSTGFN